MHTVAIKTTTSTRKLSVCTLRSDGLRLLVSFETTQSMNPQPITVSTKGTKRFNSIYVLPNGNQATSTAEPATVSKKIDHRNILKIRSLDAARSWETYLFF